MSSFGSKRKARVIKVSDEPSEEVAGDGEVSMSPGKFSDAAQSQHLDLMISSSFADEESSNYKADIAVKNNRVPITHLWITSRSQTLPTVRTSKEGRLQGRRRCVRRRFDEAG